MRLLSVVYGIVFASLFSMGSMIDSFEPLPETKTPHAVGIDLSILYIHVSEHNLSTNEFTTIGSFDPPEHYHSFMLEIYSRNQAERRNWHNAWNGFQRTYYYRAVISAARRILQRSPWTTKLTSLLPVVIGDHDFRYTFNTNLDIPVANMPALSLTKPTKDGVQSTTCQPKTLLSKSSFVQVFTEAFDQIKTISLEKHGINITMSAISKPAWVFGDMDELLEEAARNAGIESQAQPKPRTRVALNLARHWGCRSPAVIEQTGLSFEFQQESSSWSASRMGTMYIPNLLAHKILERDQFNQTRDSLKPIIFRLRAEIMLKLALFWRQCAPRIGLEFTDEPNMGATHEMPSGIQVVVRDFGKEGFTLSETVSTLMIREAEADFMNAVEAQVISHTLKFDKVHEHMKRGLLLDKDFEKLDEATQRERIFAYATETQSISRDEFWWYSVGGLLVLAEYPYNRFILTGATKALRHIPGFQNLCFDQQDPGKCLVADIAARGAALDASVYLKQFLEQEMWEKCWGGDESQCQPEYWDGKRNVEDLVACHGGDESRCPPEYWQIKADLAEENAHQEL